METHFIGDEQQRKQLLLQALDQHTSEVACRACVGQLDAFIGAQLAGEPVAQRFPAVIVHLDGCELCSGAYARLYELEQTIQAGRLAEPRQFPSFQLSFLDPTNRLQTLRELLRAAVERTSQILTLQLSAPLLALLQPLPNAAPTRAHIDASRYQKVIVALEPAMLSFSEMTLHVTVYSDAQHPERCLIEVTVQHTGRSWPELAGTTVAISAGSQMRRALTDAWGLVAFPDVPIEQLEILQVRVDLTPTA
jgi:hypothetical protein